MTTVEQKRVRDVMKSVIKSLSGAMTLAEARDALMQSRVSGAPVLADDGSLLGVFSQTDLLRALGVDFLEDFSEGNAFSGLAAPSSGDLSHRLEKIHSLRIRDVLGADLFTASPEDPIAVVARRMRQHGVHRLIVVEAGKVVGIVTPFDLLQLLE